MRVDTKLVTYCLAFSEFSIIMLLRINFLKCGLKQQVNTLSNHKPPALKTLKMPEHSYSVGKALIYFISQSALPGFKQQLCEVGAQPFLFSRALLNA